MNEFTVNFKGQEVNIRVLDAYKGYPARLSGDPDTWFPGESEYIDWEANTGDTHLDNKIDTCLEEWKNIEKQLWEKLDSSREAIVSY